MVGIDIPFPEPRNPDLTINNDKETNDFGEILEQIMKLHTIHINKK